MQLSDSQQMVRETMRNFAQQRLAPFAAAWDREHAFPRDALRELAALGACGIVVPESYGGAGLDYVSLAVALEESADSDGGDHYVLNGTKQFITSGKNADVAIVFALTDKAAGKKGMSAFIVDT